eukprot:CAMPEP_0185785356 /NCGR_PEP_ID=MMETSP1174-20130828/129125_1 /TAXON_ID=35687 /ORGANISM="Dictyocha speculum, Strain CCMP1381" /LENGTH=99 /DNA_ID=CAMNT_0028477389 /DNA_START=174 /DNA_END=470 /DNA_ORIENTATION=+
MRLFVNRRLASASDWMACPFIFSAVATASHELVRARISATSALSRAASSWAALNWIRWRTTVSCNSLSLLAASSLAASADAQAALSFPSLCFTCRACST